MSLSPVPVFIVSGALAFVWPWLTLIVWATTPFVQVVLTRLFAPAVASDALIARWAAAAAHDRHGPVALRVPNRRDIR